MRIYSDAHTKILPQLNIEVTKNIKIKKERPQAIISGKKYIFINQ